MGNMTAEPARRTAPRGTIVIHPRHGQNWGPGCEPGPVREAADVILAAETRAANERHPWIGEAMSDTGTGAGAPGTGRSPGAGR